jgi:hypothetical protein
MSALCPLATGDSGLPTVGYAAGYRRFVTVRRRLRNARVLIVTVTTQPCHQAHVRGYMLLLERVVVRQDLEATTSFDDARKELHLSRR